MAHFDRIFDEPESTGDPDEYADVKYTSYTGIATRTGKQWTVNVRDLPDGRAVLAQGSHWNDARRNTHQAIVELLGVEPHTVGVRLVPDDPDIAAALTAVVAARTARADAEQAERDTVADTARLLTSKGWSTRDAGGALSLSPQRISQLAPRDAE
ncbi:type II toxin-antitoxin system HicB family antitoxin [Nonomuraea bangladeshensis]|uniref:Type II toxin-antitoxin system HicB family antitoxin n=1 Tax=Nonomuraea bangladeshensis TaxID=404385 RepID=A0ABV3H8P2_9ACTN